jgi:MFS family permease
MQTSFRTFVILWLTQSFSAFGSQLAVFSLNIWLATVLYAAPEQRGELASMLGAVAVASAVPIVFFAPIAGAWADRHDRKRIMMTADAILGALSFFECVLIL